ncbi:MAG: ROK family protein [Bacteroidetes bacterium]|nr:ROK family protein [Bacteroidota bacterium]HOA37572.1 ROK family protein [Flavihumibacter sp.]
MTKNDQLKRRMCKQLYFAKQLSSTDLSEKVGKSLPITIKFLNELIREGQVKELGYGASTGGRRPMLYALEAERWYILSVAMDQLYTRVALLNMNNEFVWPASQFSLPLMHNDQSLQQLGDCIEKYLEKDPSVKTKILGVGIGMPGFVDVKKGVNYSFLKTDGGSITTYLEKRLGAPVFIDNDSSLIALAELRFGMARHVKDGMVVNISWGVGLGMIINGELFRGHNGFAGEFSHIPLFSNDKMCACGKTGCLETEASLLVITEQGRKGLAAGKVSSLQIQPTDSNEDICEKVFKAAQKGDRFCIGILSEIGYKIGKGISILIHLMNPEMILLSGRGATAGKVWLAPVEQALNEHCIPRLSFNTTIKLSDMEQDAEMVGAAALVMESIVYIPTREKRPVSA